MGCTSSTAAVEPSANQTRDAHALRVLRELSEVEFRVLLDAAQFWTTDANHDGLVSSAELRAYFCERRPELNCDALLERFDVSGDSMLNLDEFACMLVEVDLTSIARESPTGTGNARVRLTKAKLDTFLSAYRLFDRNTDSAIDLDELRQALDAIVITQEERGCVTPVAIDTLLAETKLVHPHGLYNFPAFLVIVAAFIHSREFAVALATDDCTPVQHALREVSLQAPARARAPSALLSLNTTGDSILVDPNGSVQLDVRIGRKRRRVTSISPDGIRSGASTMRSRSPSVGAHAAVADANLRAAARASAPGTPTRSDEGRHAGSRIQRRAQ